MESVGLLKHLFDQSVCKSSQTVQPLSEYFDQS